MNEISSPGLDGVESFTFTGQTETLNLPTGTTKITFYLWGASGGNGDGAGTNCNPGKGGGGGFVYGEIDNLEQISGPFQVQVGEGGVRPTGGAKVPPSTYYQSWMNGGKIGWGSWDGQHSAGGGGSTTLLANGQILAVAGGGGGGGCFATPELEKQKGTGGGINPFLHASGNYGVFFSEKFFSEMKNADFFLGGVGTGDQPTTGEGATGNCLADSTKCIYSSGGGEKIGGKAQVSHGGWDFLGGQGGTSFFSGSVTALDDGNGLSGSYAGNRSLRLELLGSNTYGDATTSGPGNDGVAYFSYSTPATCVCASGFYRVDGTCAECPAGFYCIGGSSFEFENPTACHNGFWSDAGAGNSSLCYCPIGNVVNASGYCLTCKQGFICPGNN